ncbi:hypothetical protein HY772_00200 [Candidatus Woesearchaeota archaeon]|nr:hypothetical protein [Candidatus Woesearchaeota archaeon]
MFSAKSGNEVYISGSIHNPASRRYSCKECNEQVFYVQRSTRHITMSDRHISIPEHFRHGPRLNHPVRDFNIPRAKAIEALLNNFRTREHYTIETEPRFCDRERTYLADLFVHDETPTKTIDTVIQVESGPFRSNDVWNAATYFSSRGMNYLLVFVECDAAVNPQGKYFRPERRNATAQIVRVVDGNEKLAYKAFKRNVYFAPSTATFAVVQFCDYAERVQHDICAPNGRVIIQKDTLRKLKTRKIPLFESRQHEFMLDYGVVKHQERTIHIARPLSIDSSLTFRKLLELERRAIEMNDGNLSERAAIALLNKVSSLDARSREFVTREYGTELRHLL